MRRHVHKITKHVTNSRELEYAPIFVCSQMTTLKIAHRVQNQDVDRCYSYAPIVFFAGNNFNMILLDDTRTK